VATTSEFTKVLVDHALTGNAWSPKKSLRLGPLHFSGAVRAFLLWRIEDSGVGSTTQRLHTAVPLNGLSNVVGDQLLALGCPRPVKHIGLAASPRSSASGKFITPTAL
jgi:hypothetical protein